MISNEATNTILVVLFFGLLAAIIYYSIKTERNRPTSDEPKDGAAKDILSVYEKILRFQNRTITTLLYPLVGALLILLIINLLAELTK